MKNSVSEFMTKSHNDESVDLSYLGTGVFWQKIFIYFWIFSIVGHYIEIIWAEANHIFLNYPLWHPIIPTFMPLAAPYGFGVVGVILFVWPLMKHYKLHPLGVFVASVIVTSVIEYICAVIIVLFVGHNYFWNYTGQFLNINGYVCLQSGLLFGAGATIFLYFVYPYCEKVLNRFSQKQLSGLFWVLFVGYGVDLLVALVR